MYMELSTFLSRAVTNENPKAVPTPTAEAPNPINILVTLYVRAARKMRRKTIIKLIKLELNF